MSETAGMILAAGFGRRLLPATRETPKPLLWYFGVPVLNLLVRQLHDAGLEDIMINAHYHRDQISEAVKNLPSPPHCQVSEEESVLGTGGAFAKIHPWRKGRDLLVVNGDIIHLFPLQKILDQHKKSSALATMGLIPTTLPGEASVWCTGKKVVSIGKESPRKDATPYGYACIQVLSDKLLSRITEEKEVSIIAYYQDALRRGDLIEACVEDCFWNDIGTPRQYWEAHTSYLDLLKNTGSKQVFDPLFINHIRESFGHGPVRWFLKEKTFFSGSEIYGPCAFDSQISFERSVKAGPLAIVMGPVTLDLGITISHCLFHKSTPYTISCNRSNIWESDSFVMHTG